MKIKNLLLFILIVAFSIPATAQLRAPFKSESTGIRFVQLPTAKKKFSKLTIKTTQKARAGEKVAEATKKASAAAAKFGVSIEDNSGMLADKEAAERTYELIPEIFPTEGDLLLEVFFYDKKLIKTPSEPLKFYDGAESEVKVEYKLYSMPGKKLIEEAGPFWVAGKGSSTAGPLQSREDLYNDRVRISRGWAKNEIMRKYALKHEYVPIEVYTIRKLKGADDDKQTEAQEKFLELARKFRTQQGEAEFEKGVNECIAIWEGLLNKYQPGKDAAVNDRSVFALYYNLATANYLLGNMSKADDYANKGAKATAIDWKPVKNNKGEVIGRKRSGIVHVTEDIFHNLKADMNAYYDGLEAHNPKFVKMLTDDSNMMKMARAVRNAAINIHLSNALNLDAPAEIVPKGMEEKLKLIKGTIKQKGNDVAKFEIKRKLFAFIPFLQRPYKVTVLKTDETLQAKQGLTHSMLPLARYDFVLTKGKKSFIGLPEYVSLGKMKAKPKARSKASTSIMYDYDGSVKIMSSSIQDKWAYLNIGLVEVTKDEALKAENTETTAEFEDYSELVKIEKDITTIKRDRELGFGGFMSAAMNKFQGKPLDVTEVSNDTDENAIDVEAKTNIKEKNDKGYWTTKEVGKVAVERELMY
ncbi:hypothetical protein L21SP5_00987 [Salinivirga cyanobacteriivorans]|uniref:Uncharacterized protein n=1 Tax=Salinivirga cyanobacteriivorans TaxID=1307839 RepID=A0A0S2HX96_9BACT|nr:hypothetical protein [Salinivirga cyanobacteriivorans]ALO14654.1 hypothetical protein L21SP5_00987 [Salinivirga cyanobacteriivorans]